MAAPAYDMRYLSTRGGEERLSFEQVSRRLWADVLEHHRPSLQAKPLPTMLCDVSLTCYTRCDRMLSITTRDRPS